MVWFTQLNTADESGRVAFYENPAASAFLGSASAQQFFICGLKGVGKTLLLRHKSAALRKTSSGIHFLPENELAESLNSSPVSLGQKEVDRLSLWTAWQTIWKSVLTVVIAKKAGIEIPENIAAIFPGLDRSLSVLDHVNVLISGNLLALVDKVLPQLSHEMGVLLGQVQSGVYIFLDAIDDLVLLHSGETLRQHDLERHYQHGRLSGDTWCAAQIGFAKAVLDIHLNHRHVRIYGAFRYEALEQYQGADRQNIDPYVLHIQYSRDDLKALFTRKLEYLFTESPHLFGDEGDNIVEKFVGFSGIDHPTVRNMDRSPYREGPLDYLLRHTRGRPRELDELGKGIQAIDVTQRAENSVRDRVRIRSREFFNWAKSEALPYWRTECDSVLRDIASNWIDRETRDAKLAAYLAEWDFDPFSYLFHQGLLGCTVRQFNTEKRELRFRQFDPMAPVIMADFEVAEFYAIHPCVNIATYVDRENYQPDPWSVSGHCQVYVKAKNKGHLHIGAGSLGLGCVVPLLAADTGIGICVLQRPGSPEWEKLAVASGEDVVLKHQLRNAEQPGAEGAGNIRLTRVASDLGEAQLDGYVEEWSRGERNLFLVETLDSPLASRLVAEANTISTAVKGKNLADVGSRLSGVVRPGTRIFPFENDEGRVAAFRDMLADRNEVVDICVDRICQVPRVGHDGAQIIASSEVFQSIVVLDRTGKARQLLAPQASRFKGDVNVVDNIAEFNFLRLRKRILVNELHFFFALASFKYLDLISPADSSVRESVVRARASQILVRTQDVQDTLVLCNKLFALGLLVEAERLGLVKDERGALALRKSIDQQQAIVLDRLQTMPDELSRILNSSDENMLEKGRLFLRGLRALPEDIRRSKVLSKKFSPGEMEQIVREVNELLLLYLGQIVKPTRP